MNVLEVEDLNVQYHTEKGNIQVLYDIGFHVGKGEIAGIVGESGSGKTTAVKAVMGLLEDTADVRGRILVPGEGRVIPGKNASMIFQNAQSCLNPSVQVGKQIADTIRMKKKCHRKEADRQTYELLDMVGIHQPGIRMKQYPFELSGGMRQRVVIAAALACEPELIIADEPTTALDAAVQAQIIQLLRRIVKETGTSLLIVSHDLGVTAALCSRVYVMRRGRIIESGSSEDIFYAPEQEYTKYLLESAGRHRIYPRPVPEKRQILAIDHIEKIFDKDEGIKDISLEIQKGEIFALAGESGSGKTTLARILTGILKKDRGNISMNGVPADKKQIASAFQGKIQIVFQDSYASLNPCLKIQKALSEALEAHWRTMNHKGGQQEKESVIRQYLEMVGLKPSDAFKYPSDFSGGERQRIGIARALIMEPEILICDESLSSLDAAAQEQILELLVKIQRNSGITYIFISHDIRMIRRISDRTGVMYGGYLIECGKTRDIVKDPWHPYTKQLTDAVTEPDPVRASRMKAPVFREDPEKFTRPEKIHQNNILSWYHEGKKSRNASGCPFLSRCGYELECCRQRVPDMYTFGERKVRCFLYSEEHSGQRSAGYRMTSQI